MFDFILYLHMVMIITHTDKLTSEDKEGITKRQL
jgi:hypothetical protein